ncbi:MAG: hypothetical protein PF518_04740 [Spirochaetaceae bacterium]|jgi:hypothetical protein|nr:hypothetical protein [Spirochaetaceae bacterium]
MFVIDRLSTEMKINYMDLFSKSNEYNHSENKKYKEDHRLHRVFLEKEIDFLACVALEYLKDKSFDDLKDLKKLEMENKRLKEILSYE